MVDFELLLSAWKPYEGVEHALPMSVMIWGEGGCGIWVAGEWGPAVPYLAVDHGDGNLNHGYQHVKGMPGAAGGIPEAQGWPELQAFLETINVSGSPIESVSCDRGYFPGEEGTPPVKLSSYIDVIFTEPALNDRPENHLALALCLAEAVEGCETWRTDVSFALERLRGLHGAQTPWGLQLSIRNYGRNEAEARKLWGQTLLRLGLAVAALPTDFRFEEE